MRRPENRLATGMREVDVESFLAAFASAAEGVDVNFRWRRQLRDAKDELVLEAAVNGRADALVTHNVRDFQPAARLFKVARLSAPRAAKGNGIMSRTAYPLKLPASVKAAAMRLAKADGVSLNQFIAVAVAEKVGVLETAQDFLSRRAGKAKPRDLLKFTRKAGRETPSDSDLR